MLFLAVELFREASILYFIGHLLEKRLEGASIFDVESKVALDKAVLVLSRSCSCNFRLMGRFGCQLARKIRWFAHSSTLFSYPTYRLWNSKRAPRQSLTMPLGRSSIVNETQLAYSDYFRRPICK